MGDFANRRRGSIDRNPIETRRSLFPKNQVEGTLKNMFFVNGMPE